MLYTDEIRHKMFEIGQRYAEKVMESGDNITTASKNFSICERAFKIVTLIEKDFAEAPATLREFLLVLGSNPILRSKAHKIYLKLCANMDEIPLKRGDFYAALREYGFSEHREKSGWMLTPPSKAELAKVAKVREKSDKVRKMITSLEG